MQLPIFPKDTKLINATLGVHKEDDMVIYLHNGSPIFCHEKTDHNNYRYILGNLIDMNLCSSRELSDALGIPIRNVQRYVKTLREKGSEWFFHRKEKRGGGHKLDQDALDKAQKLLDECTPVARVGRELGVSEGAIRYHVNAGRLKKK